MLYKNKFGAVEILEPAELYDGQSIGISMSGGADSTLLCYLLAKTIKEKKLNIKIQPYNGYDLWAPVDSAGLPNIIKHIQKIFPSVNLQWPISTVFNTHGQIDKHNDKNTYIRPLIETLKLKGIVTTVIQAVCLGPPVEVQKTFGGWGIFRQPGHNLWEEIEEAKNDAPFVNIDKRFIMQCYKDFEIEELLELTNSCTIPIGNCGECWWCQERAWAKSEVNK